MFRTTILVTLILWVALTVAAPVGSVRKYGLITPRTDSQWEEARSLAELEDLVQRGLNPVKAIKGWVNKKGQQPERDIKNESEAERRAREAQEFMELERTNREQHWRSEAKHAAAMDKRDRKEAEEAAKKKKLEEAGKGKKRWWNMIGPKS